jgi:hypothetical protein
MKRAVIAAALALTFGVACNKEPNNAPRSTPVEGSASRPGPGAPTMTDMDPKSPNAWKQAEAIAATAAHGQLTKRSDALPFMFMAEHPAAVLVHKGAVVKDRGAKAVGSYLRDLGIIMGTGPKIDDVLFVLFALDGWPPIHEVAKGINKEHYIHQPNDKSLADVTASVEFDGVNATIMLVYFLGEPVPAGGGGSGRPGDTVGSMDPDRPQARVRPMARCTLTIEQSGDSAWKIEKLNRPA